MFALAPDNTCATSFRVRLAQLLLRRCTAARLKMNNKNCSFLWNAKLRQIFVNSGILDLILSLNLEVEAELHVIGEQLLRRGLVPVAR